MKFSNIQDSNLFSSLSHMKKIVIERPGSYDQLQIKEYPVPSPKGDEVLIECCACGVNFADCCVRMGVYRSAKIFVGWPITPGFEVSGIVKEIGEGVTRFSVGDPVIAIVRFGGYTTHLTVSEKQVFPLPEALDFVQGAGFPTVFLTAAYALFELAHPRPQQTMLVHSAAGGVGSALVQLGKIADCRVIGVVGAPHKVEFLQKLGADAIIDKSTQDLWKMAEQYAPDGYDIVLDANGVETLSESYRHLNSGGKLVVYGFHTMLSKGRGKPNWLKVIWDYIRTPRFNPMNLTTDNHSILAFNLSYLFDKEKLFQEAMHQLLEWVKEGKIIPPQVTTYPLEQVAEAHRALETGQTVGKLVLTC